MCIRTETGEIIAERKVKTPRLPDLLVNQPHRRVVLDALSKSFFIADAALSHGHQVRVVAATLVRSLGGDRGRQIGQGFGQLAIPVDARVDRHIGALTRQM